MHPLFRGDLCNKTNLSLTNVKITEDFALPKDCDSILVNGGKSPLLCYGKRGDVLLIAPSVRCVSRYNNETQFCMPVHASGKLRGEKKKIKRVEVLLEGPCGAKQMVSIPLFELLLKIFLAGINRCLFGRTLMRRADSDVFLKGCIQ